MPPDTQDNPNDVRQRAMDMPPRAIADEAIPAIGERAVQMPVSTDVTRYGLRPPEDILNFGPGGAGNGTAQDVASTVQALEGQPLWKRRYPDGWQGDDPGHKGGLGCTASVSEALRQAGVFGPNEDVALASQLQATLTGAEHNWQTVGEWPGAIRDVPADKRFPSANDVKPGDVIIGYRKGEGGDNPSHSGNDAHAGIVGRDARGNLVVYSNSGVVNGEEVWEATPYEDFVKFEGFSDGVVVLRAPENSKPATPPATR